MAKYAHTADGQLVDSVSPKDLGKSEVSLVVNDDTSLRGDAAKGNADDATGAENADGSEHVAAVRRSPSARLLALAFGLVTLVVLCALAGWLGYRAYQGHEAAAQREVFVQVARQSATNLTTISYSEADADVQRILDSSTGSLYDDFLKRSQPFVEVVKQAQSTSAGTVTSAGLESVSGTEAQVLVTVQVKSTSAGAAEQAPRAWRMRMNVQKIGDGAKVSNVVFVP